MSKGEYRLDNLHLTPLYATPVYSHLTWIDAHIQHNRCHSDEQMRKFCWTNFLLFIFVLLLICSLYSYLLFAIHPTAFETWNGPFKSGLAFLASQWRWLIDRRCSTGKWFCNSRRVYQNKIIKIEFFIVSRFLLKNLMVLSIRTVGQWAPSSLNGDRLMPQQKTENFL